MSSLFFIGGDRADPMPGKNERQGRSTNIFFFHEGSLQGHRDPYSFFDSGVCSLRGSHDFTHYLKFFFHETTLMRLIRTMFMLTLMIGGKCLCLKAKLAHSG